jgi:hypothetical protein
VNGDEGEGTLATIDEIGRRFDELIQEGDQWARTLEPDNDYFASHGSLGWLTSAGNLVFMVTLGRGPYHNQAQALLTHPHLQNGVPLTIVQRMAGLLRTLKTDWSRGLVRQIEYVISAENFDTFLEHAVGYHRGGQKLESGVLASIVFEDAVRKLAKKYSLETGAEIELLIDQLAQKEAITPVMARRLKGGPAALRNKALHAKWDEFDLKDVGEAISTTRQVLELL